MTTVEDASWRRVEGMIKAYLREEKNCTLNWIYGQITKAHSIEEAKDVISKRREDFIEINKQRFYQLLAKLEIE